MKRTYYHGTSADKLANILANGLRCNTDKLWSRSCEEIYLWGVIELSIANNEEGEEEGLLIDRAFSMASESAQIACSRATDCRLVVLKIEIDEDEIMADKSCDNSEGSGAVCIGRDISPSEILEIQVSADLSLIKGCFISLISEHDYNNINFSHIELKVATIFKKAEFYPEDIDELITWENIPVRSPKRTKKAA